MWRIIEEFPDYIINDYGTIFKIHGRKSYKIMRPKKDKDGYLYIGLRNENGRYFRRIHQLVAKAYINNPNNESIVNHIDGNIENNHFTNLEWCDVAYNTRHSFEVLGREGEHTTDISCILIVDNETIERFDNIKDAAKYAHEIYGVSESSLRKYYKSGNVSIEKCND